MYKLKHTYTDYNGVERTEDFYFNLSKAELAEMQVTTEGGLDTYINKIIDAKDNKSIILLFKDLVLKAYGVKSEDGRRFIKNDEIREDFEQTEAYSDIFMMLATDADKASEFVNGITPKMPQDHKKPQDHKQSQKNQGNLPQGN